MRTLKIQRDLITNRNRVIERYLTEVGKHRPLGAEEEYQVAVKAKKGDPEAMELLITANLRFVISVAKQYAREPELLDELIAQGNIGLIDAAKEFDPSRGFKFISYAVWHIRKEILKYLNDTRRTVRLPTNVTRDLSLAQKAESELMNRLDREVTIEEIVEELAQKGESISSERIRAGRVASEKSIPFESTGKDSEESFSPSDWMSSDSKATELVESSDLICLVNLALGAVSSVDRDIILRHHGVETGNPETFQSIGDSYVRSQEWARQRYNKAIRKIQKYAKQANLIQNV